MNVKITTDGAAAVDQDYFWIPIDSCPHGVKVQLLSQGGVAIHGHYYGGKFYTHWTPLPKLRKGENDVS